MNFLKIVSVLFCAQIIALSAFAVENTESVAESPSTNVLLRTWDGLKKNTTAAHTFWLVGPNTQSLSGNKDGTGTNLTVIHYPSIGYKLGSKWRMSFTQPFNQVIDENPKSDPVTFTEPYVTFSNSRILHSDRYGTHLSGGIRYYVPVAKSSYSAVNTGSAREAGNGSLRVSLIPSKSFLDGALKLSVTNLFLYRLNRNSTAQRIEKGGSQFREDFYFLVSPSLSYELNSKLEAYVEYSSGYIRHITSGKVTKLNDPDYGQWVSFGTIHQIGKKFSLNPYLSVGPVFRGIKNTDIGLLGTYAFL